MATNRYLVAFVLGPLLALSWLLLIVVEPDGPPTRLTTAVIIGYILGTQFGQTTLAAAWTAFGPAPLLWRLPLSLAWIGVLSVALLVNLTLHKEPAGVVVLVIAICLLAQWIAVQIPLWGLAIGYGLRLRHDSDPPETPRDRQFGIRQVMILTFIVAVVLGVCRMVVLRSAQHFGGSSLAEGWFFAFLAVAGIVMTFPLLLAALLPRFSLVAVIGALALITIGTWFEFPLAAMVPGSPGGGNLGPVAWINAFQAAWVLSVVAILRFCGYGIGRA